MSTINIQNIEDFLMKITDISIPLLEGVYDPNIFKAVFMAGAPGAGKSTVAMKLFSHSGLRTLNIDNFWKLYHARNKDHDYEKYDKLLGKQQRNYIDGRLGLLIDGTARDPARMAKMKAALEELGYETAMVFVNTELDTSLTRAVAREKATGRHVNPEFIETAWEQTQANLGKLQSLFRGNFFIVDNDTTVDLDYADKSMRKWLLKKPASSAAVDWEKIQLANKTLQLESSPTDEYIKATTIDDIQSAPVTPNRVWGDQKLLSAAIAQLQKYKGRIQIPVSSETVRLFRGLDSKKPVLLIDSSKSARFITSLMNDFTRTSPNWTEYPDRTKSMFCTPSASASSMYGDTYVVFPLDNPKIGVSPQRDFWSSFRRSGMVGSIGLLNMRCDSLIFQIDKMHMNKRKMTSLRELLPFINELISKYNKAKLKELKYPGTLDDEEKNILFSYQSLQEGIDNLQSWFNQNIPTEDGLEELFSPAYNEFSLLTQDNIERGVNECWFSGPAILVREAFVDDFIAHMTATPKDDIVEDANDAIIAKRQQYKASTEISSDEFTDTMIAKLRALKPRLTAALSLNMPTLYRGLKSDMPAIIVDATKSRRFISSTMNEYLSTSPEWVDYPSRNQSIICTTSRLETTQYGLTYAVFPLDDPTIAVCPRDDFWFSFDNRGVENVDAFNKYFEMILDDIAIIPLHDGKLDIYGFSLNDLIEYIEELKFKYTIGDDNFKQNYVKSLPELTNIIKLFYPALKYNEPLPPQIERLLSPNKNGFALKKQKDIRDTEVECWFEGQAVLIGEDHIQEFMRIMKE
jgi:predicted kinase